MKVLCGLMLVLLPLTVNATSNNGIETQAISNGVFVLHDKEYATNIGLLNTDQHIVLIDPMPGKSQLVNLEQAIRQLSKDKPILLLNTHVHEDHNGGNEYFTNKGARLFNGKFEQLDLQHMSVKSHSSRDNLFYHKPSNSIFVGDIIEANWHPTFYAGGINGFNRAIDQILALADKDTIIIPGHGPTLNNIQLAELRQNTLNWLSRISQLSVMGKNLDDILREQEANNILQKFSLDHDPDFLPPNAKKRFVQRSLKLIKAK